MIARESTAVFVAIMVTIATGLITMVVGLVALIAATIGHDIQVPPGPMLMIGGIVCFGGIRIGRAVYGDEE